MPTESAIFCMLELRKAYLVDPADVAGIGGCRSIITLMTLQPQESSGRRPTFTRRKTQDHSLPYLAGGIAASWMAMSSRAQLIAQSHQQAGRFQTRSKVQVGPDDEFTARYPGEVGSRVTVRLAGGKSYSHEVMDYPGFPTRPFTWEQIGAKFDKLVGNRADAGLRKDIKAAVASLESIQVRDLMRLLGRVRAD